MPVSVEELRPHLQALDFPRLFVEGLGWDHYVTEPFVVRVSERDYALNPIAEKAGFAGDVIVQSEGPELPGCGAWVETANETLAELSTVAEQFILSYKDRGKLLPAGIA